MQRSSLAIEVLTAEEIETAGVTAPAQSSSIVSGLFVAQSGPAVQTFVRGVGSFATNSYAEAAIAYNVDGFYIARPTCDLDPPAVVSCNGKPLPKAPEWSGNASYQHDLNSATARN